VQQYEFLANYGCDYVQGYLLSRPVSLGELRPVLDQLNQHRNANGTLFNQPVASRAVDERVVRDLFAEPPVARPAR
jgi:5,10-methylene-tetrahydrofolate dehydrogenase/methenyl tetrahydrofolate cyclohydrolase